MVVSTDFSVRQNPAYRPTNGCYHLALHEESKMPIRIENPLVDPTARLNPDVNPFLGKMRQGMEEGTLPLLYGPRLGTNKGKWCEDFKASMGMSPKSMYLEIGSHNGNLLKQLAAEHPESAFVGMDITFKRVVTLAEKAKSLSLPNIKSILCNGRGVGEVFGEQELDGVIIFFPDPWVRKKRQQKNRLVQTSFLKSLLPLIKNGGFIWFKTDHKPYFDEALEGSQGIAELAEGSMDYFAKPQYRSHFEEHFRGKGEPTYEVTWQITRNH